MAPAAPIACGSSLQPKPSSDFDFEMFAEGEAGIFRQKGVVVVGQSARNSSECVRLLIADE